MYLSFILQTFVEQEKTYQKISRRRNRRHLCWPRSTGSTPNRRQHQVYLYNKLYLLVYCQLVETHFITTYISVSSQSHECTSLSCHYVAYSIERRDLTRPVVVGRLTGRSTLAAHQRQVSVNCMEQSCMSVCLYVYGSLSFVIYDKISIATLFVWKACNKSHYC